MNVYFVNLHNITKFCYDKSIIAHRSKMGPPKKICIAIIIGLKIEIQHEHIFYECESFYMILL